MPVGVYKRTEEHRRNIGRALKGYKQTEEHKRNISEALRGEKHPMYGKHHSEEVKEKQRKSHIGKKYPKEEYPDYGTRGYKFPKEKYPNFGGRGKKPWNTGLSVDSSKENYDPRLAESIKNTKRTHNRPEVKAKMSRNQKKQWTNLEYQKKMAESRDLKPNRLERIFDELTPNIIRYVGNGQLFIVTNERTHNPDFKVTGQQKIIEIWGDYHHRGHIKEEWIEEYAEVGFDCIIFWEREILKEYKRVLNETLKFIIK